MHDGHCDELSRRSLAHCFLPELGVAPREHPASLFMLLWEVFGGVDAPNGRIASVVYMAEEEVAAVVADSESGMCKVGFSSLDHHEHCGYVDRLQHELHHVFSEDLGFEGTFGSKTSSEESITMAVVRLNAKRRQWGLDHHVHGGDFERLRQDSCCTLSEDLGLMELP